MGPRRLLSPQPNKLRNGHKGLRLFCTEDEQSRSCWLAAFRLFKVGGGGTGWGADPALGIPGVREELQCCPQEVSGMRGHHHSLVLSESLVQD